MTKLLVGVALVFALLIGLVMAVSVGMPGGGVASPSAERDIPAA